MFHRFKSVFNWVLLTHLWVILKQAYRWQLQMGEPSKFLKTKKCSNKDNSFNLSALFKNKILFIETSSDFSGIINRVTFSGGALCYQSETNKCALPLRVKHKRLLNAIKVPSRPWMSVKVETLSPQRLITFQRHVPQNFFHPCCSKLECFSLSVTYTLVWETTIRVESCKGLPSIY